MEKENYEIFTLVWLDDSNTSSEKKLTVQAELRSIIDTVINFQDTNEFENYLEKLDSHERIIWIISGRLGRDLVPRFNHCSSISSIYVFCADRKKHIQWTSEYPKIRSLVTQLDRLVEQIEFDQNRRFRCKIDDPLLISIFQDSSPNDLPSIGRIDFKFVDSQMLIDYLFSMEPKVRDNIDLITLLRSEYQTNASMNSSIDQFESEYSSEKSLWWYTQDSFVYRWFNKCLIRKNFKILLRFRSIIYDIDRALDKLRPNKPVRVYRTQLLSKNEFDILEQSIGKIISVNSFFWTYLVRKTALCNFKEFSWLIDEFRAVLFEIDVDPKTMPQKPFANITAKSFFQGEQEILFMIGSLFRIKDVYQESNELSIVRLTLINEQQDELKKIAHFQNRTVLDSFTFGRLLIEMRLLDQAQDYFQYLLNEFQLEEQYSERVRCYDALAQIATEKDDFQLSLNYYEKILEIKQLTLSSTDLTLATDYNNMALVYMKKEDYVKSIELYQMALNIFQENQVLDNDLQFINCLTSMALAHRMNRSYQEALEYYQRVLSIHQQCLPEDHPDIGVTFTNIGMIYGYLSLYNEALDHYQRAIAIYEKILSPPHALMGMIYENMGNIYSDSGNLECAMISYETASTVYQKLLPSNSCDYTQIQMMMRRLAAKLR